MGALLVALVVALLAVRYLVLDFTELLIVGLVVVAACAGLTGVGVR